MNNIQKRLVPYSESLNGHLPSSLDTTSQLLTRKKKQISFKSTEVQVSHYFFALALQTSSQQSLLSIKATLNRPSAIRLHVEVVFSQAHLSMISTAQMHYTN